MHEIEIKLCYKEKDKLIQKLKELMAIFKKKEEIEDSYFSNESVSLDKAEKFLRIRQKNKNSELTFKGKIELVGDVWKRVELNSSIGDPLALINILENLGFKRILKNKTIREYWEYKDLEIAIINILEPANVDYLEVEGKSEKSINDFVKMLGNIVKPISNEHFKKLDEAQSG